MYNIDFTQEQLVDLYRSSTNQGRVAIKEALGDQLSEALPITERVKTYEDAVRELGENHPFVEMASGAQWRYEGKAGADIVAYLKLRVIVAALNEGWEPQFTEGERRWYGWYDLISKEDYEEMSEEAKANCRVVGRAVVSAGAGGGLVCSGAHHVSAVSSTSHGSRLAFKSEELAEYAAKQFIDIFADFCFLPKTETEQA
ncbi:MAG: hypothetical protein NC548_34770 [Lachnospiraceae bacterium]|nr:hypothetical protein [Lachnospiraceae bacterium]